MAPSTKHEIIQLACRWTLSILIVYAVVEYWKLPEPFLAWVSIAAVMQLSSSVTCARGIMRIIGTLLGTLLTFLVLAMAHGHPVLIGLGGLIITCIAGNIMFKPGVVSYAGIMIGITMIIILAFSPLQNADPMIALPEVGMILIGTVCALFSEWVISFFTRESFFAQTNRQEIVNALLLLVKRDRNPHKLMMMAQLLLAVAITMTPWLFFQYHDGFWAITSCFFILEESFSGTTVKSRNRLIAHFISALVAAAIVLISFNTPIMRFPLYVCAIWGICIFMIKRKDIFFVGITLSIALTIMVMGDINEFIINRFVYTLLGIVVGLAVCGVFSSYTKLYKGAP